VRYVDEIRFSPVAVGSSPISIGAAAVPLSSLAPASLERGASVLYRENLTPVAPASCDVEGEDLGGLAREIRGRIAAVPLPSGYRIEIGGRVEGQTRAFGQLASILALGMFAVFAVLVAQFRSVRASLLVLFTIPPALVGAVLFLAATGVPLNVPRLMGRPAHVGLVVKSGILLVQNAISTAQGGMPRANGARRGRRRPPSDLMTTCARSSDSFPGLSLGAGSELQRPLAIVSSSAVSSSRPLRRCSCSTRSRGRSCGRRGAAPGPDRGRGG
jgi:Cu/Ag efflux pump CusA